jgi:aminoglycoside phosphotransferase (APT) family kinase protein
MITSTSYPGNLRATGTSRRTPVFTHGDLQVTHVFFNGDEVTGVIDWSEACQGDALYDLARLRIRRAESPAVGPHEPGDYRRPGASRAVTVGQGGA